MRTLRASLPFFFVSISLLSGCGGHGGSGSSGGGSKFVESNTFTLNANVVELDKTAAKVVSVADGTVVLSGAPTLAVGQVLIHNASDGTGFLRKVVSATVSGDTTTVATTRGEINDVFKSAAIAQDTYMTGDELAKALQPAMEGLTVGPSGSGASRTVNSNGVPTIPLTFTNLTLKDGSGNAIVDVNGTVNIGAGVRKVWEKGAFELLPHEAGIYGLAYVSGQLTAHAHAAGSFSADVPLTLKGPGIPVGLLGALGVTANVQLFLKVQGSFSADGTFAATASVSTSAGVHYDAKNHWSFDKTFDTDFTLQPPSLRAQVDFGVSLIRPSFSISVLDAATVGVKADVMQVLAKITGQTSPVPGFLVEAYGDFGFTAYGDFTVGPWTLWHDERSVDYGKFSILKPFLLKTLAPTDSQIVYTEATHTKIHALNGDGTGDRILFTAPVAAFDPDVSNVSKKTCFISYDKATYAPKLTTVSSDGKTTATVDVGTLKPGHPAWRPDGTEIAFDARDAAGAFQIYVVNLSSRKIRQLTNEVLSDGGNEPKSRAQQSGAATKPTWSPDGQSIYYMRLYYGVTSIAVTSSAKHTDGVALANDTLSYSDPCLSAAGSFLVAKRSDKGIVLAGANGSNEHVIVASTLYSHPRFSPDGTTIVVQEDDNSKIVSFDLNGGNRKELASGVAPSWGLH